MPCHGFHDSSRRFGIGLLKAEIVVKLGQLPDYESRLGKKFEHAEYVSQLADLRDELRLVLSKKAAEGGTPTAELAERIWESRASVTVEAVPDRLMRKPVRAERPVTIKIKDRIAGDARPQVSEVILEPLVAEAMAETVKADDHDDPPSRKPAGFRVSVTQCMQGNGVQMSLL